MEYDQEISTAVSSDEICGVNLEDDSGFQNFFFESQGTPERFDGQTTIPASPPEWRLIKKQAIEYMKKTRDLKLISILAQAVLNTEGITKFEQCLHGLAQLIKNNWKDIYPALDEDDNDPLERISALGYLADKDFIVNIIKTLPIVNSKVLGNVTLQLIDRAVGPSSSKNDAGLEISQIIGIFKETSAEETTALYTAVNQCIVHLNDINQTFTTQAGSEYSVNFDATTDVLNHLANSLKKYGNLQLEVIPPADENADEQPIATTPNGNSAAKSAASSATFSSTNMKLTSRQDVERCFTLILNYYQECEPSSPVPILISRAKKLVNLEFLDIVKDIFPDALEQVKTLGGISDSDPEPAEEASSSGSSW